MPTYRVTFQFAGGGEGWSETHLFQSTQASIDSLFPVMDAVADARAQLLGDPFYVYAVRVANYLNDDGTRAPRGVRLWKGSGATPWAGWYNQNFGSAKWGSEPSEVAAQVVGYAAAGTAQPYLGNSNQTFLGGMPDAVIDNNGSLYPDQLNWGAAFFIWAGTLAKANSGWGWGAVQRQDDLQISTMTQTVTGRIAITVPVPTKGTYVPNTVYPARIRGVNNGQGASNGAVLLMNTAAGAFTTQEVIGIPTAQTGGNVRIYAQQPKFIQYGSLILSLVAVKHKRGKSPAAKRGRARRRIRG